MVDLVVDFVSADSSTRERKGPFLKSLTRFEKSHSECVVRREVVVQESNSRLTNRSPWLLDKITQVVAFLCI